MAEYDTLGHLKWLTTPDGRYTVYDALGRPVKTVGPVHDALGLTGIRQVTETQYTALGDVQTVRAGYRNAAGTETLTTQASFVYDDFGRVIEQTDALSHITRWVYDEHGQPVRRESANGHIVEWTYDHARGGLMTRQTAKLNATDPAPHVTDYAYDALGQVIGVDAPEVSYDYSYDNAQRLASVTDSRGPSTCSGQAKTLSYRHSPGGLLDSLEDNEGWRQDFLYDAVGRLSALQAGGERIDFIYDAGGRLQETAQANGGRSDYHYHAGGNLEVLINRTANGAEASRHTYGYDAQGRRDRHLESIAGTITDYRYGYDTLDRLRSVSTQNGATSTPVEAYQYDVYGNRRERTAQDGSVRRYLYDAAQQLTQVRSGSDTGAILAGYGYDNAGNQTQRSGSAALTLAYDALDRLASASGAGIATETYRYDHQGRRIETVTGGTPKRFVYAGQELLSEYGADWSVAQAHYAYAGLDHPLLRNTPSGNAYYHADGLGSIVATSNAAGSITAKARYDAFGQTLAKTGSIPRYGYAGREPDQTGLIYYRARYYDPALGRFGQRDPAGFADGINPYAYVGNNPISFSDPLGLSKAAPIPGRSVSAFAGVQQITSYVNSALNAVTPGSHALQQTALNYQAGNYKNAAIWGIQGGLEIAAAAVTGNASQLASRAVSTLAMGAKGLGSFASDAKLLSHFEKHGTEFGARSADEYLQVGRDIMQNGQKVEYFYKAAGETRTGYTQFMGNTSRGEAKFGFVGTNADGAITTIHTESGKSFWKMLNGNSLDKTIRPVP